MRTSVSVVRSADDVIELRMDSRNGVILSHINYSHLDRVRSTRARMEIIRGEARRIGLFEVSLAPEAVTPLPVADAAPVSKFAALTDIRQSFIDRSMVMDVAEGRVA